MNIFIHIRLMTRAGYSENVKYLPRMIHNLKKTLEYSEYYNLQLVYVEVFHTLHFQLILFVVFSDKENT